MPIIRYVLKGASGDLEKSLGRVNSQLSDSAKSFGIATVALGLFSTGAIKSAGAVIRLQQEVINLRNELGDMSAQTQLSVETLAALRVAAGASNEQLGSLAGGLRRFSKQMADAAEGTGEAVDAFERLGVRLTDDVTGELRDADTVFRETIELLQRMSNGTQRAATANDLFGRSGAKLSQVIGDIPLEEFNERAQLFGADIGPEAIEAAQGWQASLQDLSLVTDSVKASIADAFSLSARVNIQAITDAFLLFRITYDELATIVDESDLARDFREVRDTLLEMAIAAQELLPAFGPLPGVLGRIQERFLDVRAGAQALEIPFAGPLPEALDKTAESAKVAAEEFIGLRLSLQELGELSTELFGEGLLEGIAAASEEMQRQSDAAFALDDALDQVAESDRQRHEEQLKRIQEIKRANQELTRASLSAFQSTLGSIRSFVDESSAAFVGLFLVEQAAAAARTVVNTHAAIMAALTIPPPVGEKLALARGVAGAAALAGILGATISGVSGGGGGAGGGNFNLGGDLAAQATAGAGQGSSGGTRARPRGGGGGGSVEPTRDLFIVFRHELLDASIPTSVAIPNSAMRDVQKNGARVGQRVIRASPRKLLV